MVSRACGGDRLAAESEMPVHGRDATRTRELSYQLEFLLMPLASRRCILCLTSIAAVTLAACGPIDTMKEGFAHSQAVSDRLERDLGRKSFVGFNFNNGQLTSVKVTFDGIPEQASLADIAETSKQAVLAEFKQTPNEIIVAFTIKP
jgi:hypothetical protein